MSAKTIATIDQLRALPDGSLIRNAAGEFGETITYRSGERVLRFTKSSIGPAPLTNRQLPATILFQPEDKTSSEFKTEWGVKSPWGCDSYKDRDTAEAVAGNMRDAGHEASVIWRGVTAWHHTITDERAMQPVEVQP